MINMKITKFPVYFSVRSIKSDDAEANPKDGPGIAFTCIGISGDSCTLAMQWPADIDDDEKSAMEGMLKLLEDFILNCNEKIPAPQPPSSPAKSRKRAR